MPQPHFKTLLSIAGSDSSGGAGIQADIKTASAFGLQAMTVVTSITAQNSMGVERIENVSPEIVQAQLEAVFKDVTPDAIKIGMIGEPKIAELIAYFLKNRNVSHVVIDPVIKSTSGTSFSCDSILDIYKGELFPLSTLVTPNIPEATCFTGIEILSLDDMRRAALRFLDYGCKGVLLKGGHCVSNGECNDYLLYDTGNDLREHIFRHEYIESRNTHGTGCTLSSAIASSLALGKNLMDASSIGIKYLLKAIKLASGYEWGHGKGHGPLHFFHQP